MRQWGARCFAFGFLSGASAMQSRLTKNGKMQRSKNITADQWFPPFTAMFEGVSAERGNRIRNKVSRAEKTFKNIYKNI